MVRLVNPNRRPVRNYLSRREQWRLLILILPLGLVIVLMAKLRDPKTANQINQYFAPAERQSDIKPRPVVADAAPRRSPAPFAGVRPELLDVIEDNSYFRNAEKAAWFHLFEIIQLAPLEALKAAPSVEVGYVQLVDQPHVYRGKLVSIYGEARQITRQTPAPNDLGIDSYYRVVIQPDDDSNWPIFVYCRELPAGLSQGEDLARRVKATGLFFKKLSYQWQNGLGIAPVIVATSIEELSDASGDASTVAQEVTTDDVWKNDERRTANAADQAIDNSGDGRAAFRDILKLAGWDRERLAQFDDRESLTDEQRLQALEVLRRLRSLDSVSLRDWSHYPPRNKWLDQPEEYRGRLLNLIGYVKKVTKLKPAASEVERLEMPEYFECELALDRTVAITTILTTRVPKTWLRESKLEEPVIARALYLKRLANEEPPSSLWVAKEIEWYPGLPSTSDERFGKSIDVLFGDSTDRLFGKSILGTVGMDVGLLDDVQPRGHIRTEEREAFYQMMSAVEKTSPHQLIRFAQTNLPAVGEYWKRELQSAAEESRRKLAALVVERASKGRYSVAPLFNDPENHIGQLVVVDGNARRAVRVEVGGRPDGKPSDVARRFGIDHYYELEVFTDDSHTYPLVFCMRELPANFPIGGELSVPVRVAGFFFKDWLYRTRQFGAKEGDGQAGAAGRSQYAPLLIGRAPVVLATPPGGGEVARFVAGGVFMLALVSIWAVAAWFARGDRRFRERTLAPRFSLQPGQSLNELNLPVAGEPMTMEVKSIPDASNAS